MKNNKAARGLAFLFTLPIAALMCLCLLLYTPFDYIKYRRSRFFRDMRARYGKGAKYSFLLGISYPLRTYDLMVGQGLAAEYVLAPGAKLIEGYFLYRGTLLVLGANPYYDHEQDGWYVTDQDAPITAEAYLANELSAYAQVAAETGLPACERAVLLFEKPEPTEGKDTDAPAPTAGFLLPYEEKNLAATVRAALG